MDIELAYQLIGLGLFLGLLLLLELERRKELDDSPRGDGTSVPGRENSFNISFIAIVASSFQYMSA